MDTVRESEGGGGVTPPPINYVMDGAGATETAVGITLARRCDWACRNGTTRNAVEISNPHGGRCGTGELAGGDIEEESENAKTVGIQHDQSISRNLPDLSRAIGAPTPTPQT
jgi:hypothetical protein